MRPIITLSLFLVYLSASSQELPDLKAFKHDIGFNTTFLLNGIVSASTSPFDLMYKIQKSSSQAIRLGASVYVNTFTNTYSSISNYQISKNYDFQATFGKEWQKQITRLWIFYYGGDLGVTYNNYQSDYYNNSVASNESQSVSFGGLAAPFLGIRFQINERLYLATEASLRMMYTRKNADWKVYNYEGVLIDESQADFNELNFTARPASGIFVYYRF